MGKSVNDYYAEKLQRLRELDKNKSTPRIASASNAGKPQKDIREGKAAYERFARENISAKKRYEPPKVKTPYAKTPPKPREERRKINPEQTEKERIAALEKRKRAAFLVKLGKRRRLIREMLITAVLLILSVSVLAIVVYNIFFNISDIQVLGCRNYTPEEIISATGVKIGDGLYSFRTSLAKRKIILNCPEISEVDIDKDAPNTVIITVKEEEVAFYSEFFGEWRAVSGGMRILEKISPEQAKNDRLIKLILPKVTDATAGKNPEFENIRNDNYIYDVTSAVLSSDLKDRIGKIDISEKYGIKMVCDGKYLLYLGNSDSVVTKLQFASEVLKDSALSRPEKMRVDVSDLSEASVVIDNDIDTD